VSGLSLISQIETMSAAELQLLMQKATQVSMYQMQEQMKAIANKMERLEEKQDRVLDVAVNSVRVKQAQYEYVNQKKFGAMFTVSIGAKMVGRLFKAIGLAQAKTSETMPYRHFIPKYAKPMANENYTAWLWHYENCLNYLDKWLSEKGLYEQFYSVQNERDMEALINQLYDKYC
jgi:hypothetical protein